MMNHRETVVMVLNWNGWDDSIGAVESLVAAGDDGVVIWLVDNGSSCDGSREITNRWPQIRIVRLEQNFGWSGGYNRALKLAVKEGFKFAFLLNNDARVNTNWLSPLIDSFDANTVAVGCKILFEDGHHVRFDGKYFSHGQKEHECQLDTLQVEKVNGSAMMISMRLFERVGPFDERFFCYGEEDEWCYRADRLGLSVRLQLQSTVRHRGGGSDVGANAAYYRVRNRFIVYGARESYIPHLRKRMFMEFSPELPTNARHSMQCAIADGSAGKFGPRTTFAPSVYNRFLTRAYRTRAGTWFADLAEKVVWKLKRPRAQ